MSPTELAGIIDLSSLLKRWSTFMNGVFARPLNVT